MVKHDFSGWATRVNVKCSDGRVILKDAFKHCDGKSVPLVWNHQHSDVYHILGNAVLEHRDEGVYAWCSFNDTEQGRNAKRVVKHGDICALSIFANQLKQRGSDVYHGMIREVSLVLVGANPEAKIEDVITHSDDVDGQSYICTNHEGFEDNITLYHADDEQTDEDGELEHADEKSPKEIWESFTEEEQNAVYYLVDQAVSGEDADGESAAHSDTSDEGKTVGDIFEAMSEEKQELAHEIIGMAIAQKNNDTAKHSDDFDNNEELEGGDTTMKRNVFDKETQSGVQDGVLTHADQAEIIRRAKQGTGTTLKQAFANYISDNETMAHGFVNEDGEDGIDMLFPEYKDVKPGAPELVERDLTWVDHVMRGVHKSPISRIRTRFADARSAELRAKGYKGKGNQKQISGDITLVQRTTDPQTVYRKDTMHRDDIIDITDFDVVEYQYKVMRHNMEEELALAIMIGDGREEDDADKISEKHIRSIWNDNDLYTIHADVDFAAAKAELQGSNTSANFGDNYIYAEAIISAALYSREKYKGKGNLEFYCTPHLLNVMLLARDLNGRRIYESKADLAAALNVRAIHTVEQFEGKTRTDKDGKQKKLLGLFVNLSDYYVGSTKGGEITRFSDFDIDFNQYKYLIETRLSGAMVNLYSAIALEEPVAGE